MTQHYDPNHPAHLRQSIKRTERRLQELRLREEIAAINTKLKMLNDIRVLYSTKPISACLADASGVVSVSLNK